MLENKSVKTEYITEDESIIALDSFSSLLYAKDLGGRFPKGELVLSMSGVDSISYSKIIESRFELGEKAIFNLKAPNHSIRISEYFTVCFLAGELLDSDSIVGILQNPNISPIYLGARNEWELNLKT